MVLQFIKDHPEIILRVPQSTSMARYKCFNKKNDMDFFDKYEIIFDKEKYTASQTYNIDETGLSTSGERCITTITTTCICCMNAAGECVLSLLIFRRRRRTTDYLKKGKPLNTIYTCSDSE